MPQSVDTPVAVLLPLTLMRRARGENLRVCGVCVLVCACVRVCVLACVRVCVCAFGGSCEHRKPCHGRGNVYFIMSYYHIWAIITFVTAVNRCHLMSLLDDVIACGPLCWGLPLLALPIIFFWCVAFLWF